MERLRAETLRLGQTTSIKGIPRSVKTERTSLRVLWALSTILFLGIATYQTVMLTIEYLEYRTFTSVEEISSAGGDSEVVTTPSITLCNLNPLASNSSDIIDAMGYPSFADYYDLVTSLTTCNNCSAEELRLLNYLKNELSALHGYYAFAGRDVAHGLGHKLDNILIECKLQIREGFRSVTQDCFSSVSVQSFTDYYYYNCWTLNLPEDSDMHVVGVTFTLHLDNYMQLENEPSGALLMVHEPGRAPTPRSGSVRLAAGHYNDVQVSLSHRSHLGEPYSNCKGAEEVIWGTDWRFTTCGCLSSCLEYQVATDCQCRDLFSLNLLEDMFSQLPYCTDAALGRVQLLENFLCTEQLHVTTAKYCNQLCMAPCIDTLYGTSTTQSTWPTHAFSSLFYGDYIHGRDYEWRYPPTLADAHPNQSLEVIAMENQIRNNFLQANVHVDSFILLDYSDTPQASFSAYVSGLGGILNLFAGITIVVVVELLDFLIRLCIPQTLTLKINDVKTSEM